MLIHSQDKTRTILQSGITQEFRRIDDCGVYELPAARTHSSQVDCKAARVVISVQEAAVPRGTHVRARAPRKRRCKKRSKYRSKRKRSSGTSTTGSIGRGELMPGMSDVEMRCTGAPLHTIKMSENKATKVCMLKNLDKGGHAARWHKSRP